MSYVASLEEALWGISLVAITMAIHGCGMLATLFACHISTGVLFTFAQEFQSVQLPSIHKRRAERRSLKARPS